MFEPFEYIKKINRDDSLSHRDTRFLTNVVLHTDNATGEVRCSVEQIAREVDIHPANASRMINSCRYDNYLIKERIHGRRNKLSWQPLVTTTTCHEDNYKLSLQQPEVVTTTTTSCREDNLSTLIYNSSTSLSTEAPEVPMQNQENKENQEEDPLSLGLSRSDQTINLSKLSNTEMMRLQKKIDREENIWGSNNTHSVDEANAWVREQRKLMGVSA